MRSLLSLMILAGFLAAATAAGQQSLVCPGAPAGRPCDAFHYHVQMWSPETRQFIELSGVNRFSTQAACESARESQTTTNANIVRHFSTLKQRFEADRMGPCHCDMTTDTSSTARLTDAQRKAQLRTAEEVKLRVRERLLDTRLTTDSELVRALWAEPPATPMLGAPKFVPPPQSSRPTVLTAVEDLMTTRAIDQSRPAVAALDVPLVDVGGVPVALQTGTATSTPPAPDPLTAPQAPAVAPDPAPEEEIVVAEPPSPEPAADPSQPIESTVPDEDVVSAQETAERFISYETQRIQDVLRAAAAIGNENVKSKIFEACMQRIKLLSNLRLLIEGSGMRSRLAVAAREADQESERLALVRRLFGEGMERHWAPKDAADVIIEVDPEVASMPERTLRDTTGAVSLDEKKRALYLVLAQTQPMEDQRLWLARVIEGFLR